MNEVRSFVEMLVVFTAFVLPIVVAVRLAAGPDVDLASRGAGLPWPRGVQEEEPTRWSLAPAEG